MIGRPPSIGDKGRYKKIVLMVTEEMLSDFKAIASIDEKTMSEKLIALIEKEITSRSNDLQAFRAIQMAKLRTE